MAETRSLREEVEDFLYAEAALLDAWRLDEWAALFTEDARYVVPTTDLPEGDPTPGPDVHRRRHCADSGQGEALNSRHAHREYPSSRTRRFISNVRVEETGDGELAVRANALVYRFRSGEGDPFVGHYEYRLKRAEGGGFRIRYRRAVLDHESLTGHGAVSIIF